MVFSEKLQGLRKSRGWTQEQLAEQAGVSRQTLSKWELGTAKPDADNIIAVSKIFGVSTDYLLIDDYTSDADLPAVRQSSRQLTAAYQNRIHIITGSVIFVLSFAGVLLLGILGSIYPTEYFPVAPGLAFTEDGFLKSNHLEWLFMLCMIIAAAGILVIIWPKTSGIWSGMGRVRRSAAVFTGFSLTGMVALYMFSRTSRFVYMLDDVNVKYTYDELFGVGGTLGAFLRYSHLEWLFFLCLAVAVMGVLMLSWPKIKRVCSKDKL